MFGIALRGRWLFGTVVVVLVAILMVNLGLWQLRRLDERKARNVVLSARRSAPALDNDELSSPKAEFEHRRVVLSGRFKEGQAVLLAYRSLNGVAGYHTLASFELVNGETVLINRGWVPLDFGERFTGSGGYRARLEGIVQASRPESLRWAVSGPEQLPTVKSANAEALKSRLGLSLTSLYVEQSGPDATKFPIPLEPASLDEGPHLSYALQWFSFSLIAMVSWSLRLYQAGKSAKREFVD